MGSEQFNAIPAVHVLLERDDDILLMCRKTCYYAGYFGLPSGDVEQGEPVEAAARRESLEEIGVIIGAGCLQLAHVLCRPAWERNGDTRIDFFYTTTSWQGDPCNNEPTKCSGILWNNRYRLPPNMVPEVRQGIECINKNKISSEMGWS